MLASFYCDLSGVPVVQELALMNLTAERIPFESVYEQELFAALIQQGRRFSKSQRSPFLSRSFQMLPAT
jgi:hypothetical protein